MQESVNSEVLYRRQSLTEQSYRRQSLTEQSYRRQSLIDEIINNNRLESNLCEKLPLNILVIGPPGCGKSSFLNTVFASFNNDGWREIARSGRFSDNRQVTRLFKSFTKEIYYRGDSTALMPVFLKINGLENEDSERNHKFLNIILSGKVQENESLNKVICDIIGDNKIFRFIAELKYHRRPVYRRIDRIIAISSCDPSSNLSSKLLNSISICAAEKDIKVFGVLTHADKLKLENFDNNTIQQRERKFKELLGIPDNRFARITNYNSDIDSDRMYEENVDPTLDVPVLILMKQVLQREATDGVEKQQDRDLFYYISLKILVGIVIFGSFITLLIDFKLFVTILMLVVAYFYYEWYHRVTHYI